MKRITEYNSEKLINSEVTVHIFSSEKSTPVHLHIHDFIEIVYILCGTARQYVNRHEYNMRRGDVLFIKNPRCSFTPRMPTIRRTLIWTWKLYQPNTPEAISRIVLEASLVGRTVVGYVPIIFVS